MVEGAVGAKNITLLLTFIGFCGCQRPASYITVSAQSPQSQAQAPSVATAPEQSPSEPAGTLPPNGTNTELNKDDIDDPAEPAIGAEDPTIESSALTPISTLIRNTSWVLIHEGKKIGTACNAFVGRVLEVSGFSSASFLANDFDLYAKKYIRSYKAVDFKNDVAGGAEIARLKSHLWSYPERTPFILQWSRSGMHGHIAIVERVKDQLIIYQANLNKYTARKGTTTVQSLLSGFNRRILTVYTDLKR